MSLHLTRDQENELYWQAANLYDSVSKKSFVAFRKKGVDEGEELYKIIRSDVLSGRFVSEAVQATYKYEYKRKHDAFYGKQGLLATARSPFFLASAHPRPAKDHADYEGRMYYDEEWEEKGAYSEDEKNRIRAYIRNRRLLSIQYVTGSEAGIYLTLRRNCKHFFKEIPVEVALHSSVKKLLKSQDMIVPEEASVPRSVLEYRAAYYKTKFLSTLVEVIPSKTLDQDLKRSRILLKRKRAEI